MADTTTVRLRLDEASQEQIEAVLLTAHRLRLEETPLLGSEPIHAGDIVEVDRLPDGTYQFLRVIDRAPMRHYAWVVPEGWHDSPDRDAYVAKVEAAGGRWEQTFGGLLRVHVPLDSAFDAEAELDRYLGSDWAEA